MTKALLSPCLGSPALCYLPVCTCAQWYLTLCNPVDGILPGSSVHGIFQARILELVAISYSRTSSQLRDKNSRLFCLLHWQADSLSLVPPASSLAHLGEEKMPRESKKKTFSLPSKRLPLTQSFTIKQKQFPNFQEKHKANKTTTFNNHILHILLQTHSWSQLAVS